MPSAIRQVTEQIAHRLRLLSCPVCDRLSPAIEENYLAYRPLTPDPQQDAPNHPQLTRSVAGAGVYAIPHILPLTGRGVSGRDALHGEEFSFNMVEESTPFTAAAFSAALRRYNSRFATNQRPTELSKSGPEPDVFAEQKTIEVDLDF